MNKQEKDKIKIKISNMEMDKIESSIFIQEKRFEREKFILDALIAERNVRNSRRQKQMQIGG